MKIVSCLRNTELEQSPVVTVEGLNIVIRILGAEDRVIDLTEIPRIQKVNEDCFYYAQIGTCLYIAYENKANHIIFLYVIEQEIKNNKLSIKNIYSDVMVGERNILARFFRYDREFQQENLKERLIKAINAIPVIIEKEYLRNKILEYLENEEEQNEFVKEIFDNKDII